MLDALLGFLTNYVLIRLFYWPGRITLKILTLGRYPPERNSDHNEEFVAVFGLIVLAASAILIHVHLYTA